MYTFNTDHLEDWRRKEIEEGGYWIIPSHKIRQKNSSKVEAVHYWMVTIMLTSGDVKQFYIKARNHQEALEKAKKYDYLAHIKTNGEWKLLP